MDPDSRIYYVVESVARALGSFYTPAALAEPLCHWAIRSASDRVLDPSCGDGAFLVRAVDHLRGLGVTARHLPDRISGVDLDPRALDRARRALLSRHPGLRWSRLLKEDFFTFATRHRGKLAFDAVVGNPPFLRTQGRSMRDKRLAVSIARACGAALNGDASTWAPFVAASASFVRPGGRLAMIVPREALFVNYARPLMEMLRRRFATVRLAALRDPWFNGALVRVAALLCEGQGPGRVQTHEVRTVDEMTRPPAAPSDPTWVWSRMPAKVRTTVARRLADPELAPLPKLGRLSIGIVTGERNYFVLDSKEARERGLPRRLLRPALTKPSQLRGTHLVPRDRQSLGRMLVIPTSYRGGHAALDAYLAEGRKRGIDQNYKCRTRKPWYAVRRVEVKAHLFLGYLVKRRPRVAANRGGTLCTNNLHRITLDPTAVKRAGLLAAASYNAATMLSIELLGRIGGGGVLKIEPGDASKILLPRPDLLAGGGSPARAINRALREGRDADAFSIADGWIARVFGWKVHDMSALRQAQAALRDERLAG